MSTPSILSALTSTPSTEPDPFADVVDEDPASNDALRRDALTRVKRLGTPLRNHFVQKPNTSSTRPSILSEMVKGKKALPLRTYLLIHALEPMLDDTSWTLTTWTKLVGGTQAPAATERMSEALRYLETKQLITRKQTGQRVHVYPLLEDGSGRPFERASALDADVGKGYFTIPHDFWLTGLADRLKLPGLAMFLVALQETQIRPSYQIAYESMPEWYGISERTAERGNLELSSENILRTKTVKANAIKSPTMVAYRVHRALAAPYSMHARAELQAKTRAAATASRRSDPVTSP